MKEDCLAGGYVSSLLKEVHAELKQNDLTELESIWEQISRPNKKKFCDQYGQIALLIAIKVDEPLFHMSENKKIQKIPLQPDTSFFVHKITICIFGFNPHYLSKFLTNS